MPANMLSSSIRNVGRTLIAVGLCLVILGFFLIGVNVAFFGAFVVAIGFVGLWIGNRG